MIDYFALLQQPRRPWLRIDELEKKYRDLARTTHPDAASPHAQISFADLNSAYRTLRDPKLRLQHLLALEGAPPLAGSTNVPSDLAELFMNIASVIEHRDGPPIESLRQRVEQLFDEALQQLRQLDSTWTASEVSRAEILYRRFSILLRWQELLAAV
jgi:Fe-S protein assembly co-chaperone HscB